MTRTAVRIALAAIALVASTSPTLSSEASMWEEIVVPVRNLHAEIHDPVRQRLIVFGGRHGAGYRNDVWVLSLVESDPEWRRLDVLGGCPSRRYGPTAVHDPVRDRMVVFGGYDGDPRNDVWVLDLAGAPTWSELAPAGAAPQARYDHSAIYDPIGDRMIIWGGWGQDARVWALALGGTPTWHELAPVGPAPLARYHHTAIYDPLGERMVVFGGSLNQGYTSRNDVWALSLSGPPTWNELSPLGVAPVPREGHAAVYDPSTDRMVVFGGNHGGSDVWAFALAGASGWTVVAPVVGDPPPGRAYHSMVYDPPHERVVVFGGTDAELRNDTWELALGSAQSWKELTPGTTPPPKRYDHTAIHDPVRDRMLVFGGHPNRDDVRALGLSGRHSWTELEPLEPGPGVRQQHSAIYDPIRDRMVVFGGYDVAVVARNDVWALGLSGAPAWSELAVAGVPPSPRQGHTAIYDPIRDRMIVFGGWNASFFPHGDVWELSFAGTPTWNEITPPGSDVVKRANHAAFYDPVRDRMVVFGGARPGYVLNDTWALTLSGTPAWAPIAAEGAVVSRANHSLIYDPLRDRMVVFAGVHYEGVNLYTLGDTWTLPLSGASVWSETPPSEDRPISRSAHTAIHDAARDRMIVFAGSHGYDDVWALQWDHVTGIAIERFEAERLGDRVVLHWRVGDGSGVTSFRVHRASASRTEFAAMGEIPASGGREYRWEDASVTRGRGYRYRLEIVYADGSSSWEGPVEVSLEFSSTALRWRAGLPNPFVDEVALDLETFSGNSIRVRVFDVAGQWIVDLVPTAVAGGARLRWDGRDRRGHPVPAGVYLVRAEAGDRHATRRIVRMQ